MYKTSLRAGAGLFLIHPLTYVSTFKNIWSFKASGSDDKIDFNDQDDIQLIKDKFSKLRDHYGVPKYPIVLCHGFSGFDTLSLFQSPKFASDHADLEEIADNVNSSGLSVSYWRGISDSLTKAGADVIIAKVPPFGSIEERAGRLDALLAEKCSNYKDKVSGERLKINIVGHSMGGLDARYLISKLQNEKSPYQVVSLTTVGTPHHGSECADFIMEYVNMDTALQAICPKSIPELTTSHMKKFNKEILNDKNVAYFSYGASMPPKGIRVFRATYEIIKHEILKRGEKHYENDGMVSVKSSKWGKYLGTLQDVDHLDLINWTNRIKTAVDQIVFDRSPTFNPIALYLDIAENLSKQGF